MKEDALKILSQAIKGNIEGLKRLAEEEHAEKKRSKDSESGQFSDQRVRSVSSKDAVKEIKI